MSQSTLKQSYILRYWLPLASTWIMMAVEGPLISAVIARMDRPIYNLAAFGITYAIGLIMEAPVIMLMAATTKLVKGYRSFLSLRRFSHGLIILCTLTLLGALLPAVFDFWTRDLLGISQDIIEHIWLALACLLPWPGMIGYRRFYQGVLITAGKTKRVAAGTLVRMIMMTTSIVVCYYLDGLDGAAAGTFSLSVGVTSEAIFVRIVSHKYLSLLASSSPQEESELSQWSILKFYYPLALTALIGLTAPPLVTFAMNRGLYPVESLAATPVINGLVFFFRAIPLSFQEVIISLLARKEDNYKALAQFALWLGLALTTY